MGFVSVIIVFNTSNGTKMCTLFVEQGAVYTPAHTVHGQTNFLHAVSKQHGRNLRFCRNKVIKP